MLAAQQGSGAAPGGGGGDPFAFVDSASAAFTNPSSGATTSAIDTTGATFIVITIAFYTGIASVNVSDSKSNTWTASPDYDSGSGNPLIRHYYCVNPTVGSGHTFTLGAAANGYASIAVAAFSGPTAVTLDDDNSTPGSIADSPEFSGSVTPSIDGALLIAAAANGTIAIDSFSGSPAFTVAENVAPGVNYTLAVGYYIQATAGSINSGWNWSAGAGQCVAALTAFRPS